MKYMKYKMVNGFGSSAKILALLTVIFAGSPAVNALRLTNGDDSTWILLSGYSCLRTLDTHPTDVVNSENSCIKKCANSSECKVVQWIDLGSMSETGNQKYCSFYRDFTNCQPFPTSYIKKEESGDYSEKFGKYCSALTYNRTAILPVSVMLPATEMVVGQDGSRSPGREKCELECSNKAVDTEGNKCVGFNYMPQYITFPANGKVMPCWMFFTSPCRKETQSRIFFKVSDNTMSIKVRQTLRVYTYIADTDYVVVSLNDKNNQEEEIDSKDRNDVFTSSTSTNAYVAPTEATEKLVPSKTGSLTTLSVYRKPTARASNHKTGKENVETQKSIASWLLPPEMSLVHSVLIAAFLQTLL